MILWCSDTHFNFLRSTDAVLRFGKYMRKQNPDAKAMVITGDISDGRDVVNHLKELADGFDKPIYFVLGNHDYYHSSFEEIDAAVDKLVKEDERLIWLNKTSLIQMNDVPIVGCNGWYDLRYGNSQRFGMRDYDVILDLSLLQQMPKLLVETIRAKADYEAGVLMRNAVQAIQRSYADTIIVCTHVSPYKGASYHERRLGEDDSVGCFSSLATCKVLNTLAEKYDDKTFLVLCGHSHNPAIYKHSHNIHVYCGRAEYGNPEFCGKIYPSERKIRAYDYMGEQVDRKY